MFQLPELLAVISAACFGVLLARSKQMDMVGVCTVAFIVAFAGGTLRDVLLDRRQLFWIANEHYAWITFLLGVVGSFVPRVPPRLQSWLSLPDALGLGLFTIVGAGVALEEQDTSLFIASLFGVMTGTFGGVLGDIVCNDVPNLFRPTTPLYASVSFVGCWLYLWLRHAGVEERLAQGFGVGFIVVMRLVAIRWNLRLPATRP